MTVELHLNGCIYDMFWKVPFMIVTSDEASMRQQHCKNLHSIMKSPYANVHRPANLKSCLKFVLWNIVEAVYSCGHSWLINITMC